jgi:pimeloyl-ACP methyl ester carboxylesterase
MSPARPSSEQAPRTLIRSSRREMVESGRTIGYRVTGAEDGPLVVLLDGTGSRALGCAMTPVSVELGIKLLVPDAPCLDSSVPARRQAFAAVAGDLVTLVDCAGFKRFGIVAAPGGIPYALALAEAAGDRVTGIAFVAALAPLPEGGAIRNLAGPMRPVFRVARQAPWLLHPMFNAYARQVQGDLPTSGDSVAPLLREDVPVASHDVAESATQGSTSAEIVTSPAALARETRMLARQPDRGRDGITAPLALWATEIDALADAPSSNSDGRRGVPELAIAAVYPEMLRHAAGLP